MPSLLTHRKLSCAALAVACWFALAAPAGAQTPASSGGATYTPPPPPAAKAALVNGQVIPPAGAPRRVVRVIRAANRIASKPYRYGGGHKPFSSVLDSGYDCSGAVSFALNGGRFLGSPLPSGALMKWGERGAGRWITVYAHGGHAYMVVAGLRFDTSLRDADAPGPRTGPRWSRVLRSTRGFTARHPAGY
jgi:hypothetical protein